MRGFRDRNDNFNIKEFKKRLSSIKGEIRYGEPMKNHTSFKIGGPADIMVFPQDLQDLANLLHIADEEKVSLFILGKGSNILVKDGGVRGIVVNLQRFDKIMIESEDENGEAVIFAEAGVNLSRLLNFTASHGLTGLEFTAGIPGSVGGAVFMNAGSFDGEIKDVLKQVRMMDLKGNVIEIDREDIKFSYRTAKLPKGIILGGSFALHKNNSKKIKDKITTLTGRRKEKQPIGVPSAGSVFKNPAAGFAGALIESAGLKGYRIGDAEVSEKHANFIVNKGRAIAKDVISLINLIKEKVKKEKGVALKLEIKIIGRD